MTPLSGDSQTVYYHTVVAQSLAIPALLPQRVKGSTALRNDATTATTLSSIEYDEIHRIDLSGYDSVLWRHVGDGSSLRLVGIDASGELIVTQARQQQAVTLVRIATASTKRMPLSRVFGQPFASLTTLPADIIPGNVLRLVNNGTALECERVLSWQPLRYTLIDINLMTGAITGSQPLFKISHDGTVTPFSVAPDHTVQVMAQTTQVRRDLAVQGIANGNNPNDVSSSVYGHWYPGAPFRSIYEEYAWYFAAHPQAWTANYLPSLDSSQLPPQSDFVQTSDSFVACVACTIPDWTNGSYDRDWVGVGAPNAPATSAFQALFQSRQVEKISLDYHTIWATVPLCMAGLLAGRRPSPAAPIKEAPLCSPMAA